MHERSVTTMVAGLAAALLSDTHLPQLKGGWTRAPGRPGIKQYRAKRKVRNRMAKLSRRRNRRA